MREPPRDQGLWPRRSRARRPSRDRRAASRRLPRAPNGRTGGSPVALASDSWLAPWMRSRAIIAHFRFRLVLRAERGWGCALLLMPVRVVGLGQHVAAARLGRPVFP